MRKKEFSFLKYTRQINLRTNKLLKDTTREKDQPH